MKRERFDEILESGALALGAQAVALERAQPGRRISHYRIVEEIGAGGMGVVYRAFDTKLERDVALKILLVGPHLWGEARAAASLKHPNIAVVYEVGEEEDITFLSMELLEGESLATRLATGALRAEEASEIALGILSGLAHAHERGVRHRDLKPANIMLTAHGPKIIDFGLAGELDDGPLMGTPAYAAPEQLSGECSDARSDVYSAGVLLKQLLGDKFRRVTDRAVAANPKDRFQTAGEMLGALRGSTGGKRILSWRAVVMVALVAILTAVAWLRPRSASNITLTHAVQLTSDDGVEEHAQWSSDGWTLAYEASSTEGWDIWLANLDGRRENLTVRFEGAARFPSWSPDGTRLAFWSEQRSDVGHVMMMSTTTGSAPARVTTTDTAGAPQWSANGSRLMVLDDAGAKLVTSADGTAERIELPGESARRFDLSWSPDERFLAYVDANAALDEVTRLWVLRLSDQRAFRITDGHTNVWSPSWSESADTLYFVTNVGGGMDLWRVPFGSNGPSEAPEPVTVGVGVRNAAFSGDGSKLAYSKGRRVANVWRVPISEGPARWADAEQLTFDQALIEFVDVSPDAERLVFSSDRSGNQDLWILPVEGGDAMRVTSDRAPDWAPAWSPDGQEIAFYSYRSGNRDIWLVRATGGPARQLTRDSAQDYRMAFSPDGRELVFDSTRSGSWDLWSMELDTTRVRPLAPDPAIDSDARFSPDGRRLVFGSQRSGSFRLWELPQGESEPRPLSRGPGRNPRFSPDGGTVFFLGDGERAGNIWRLDPTTRDEWPATALEGHRGSLGASALATDGRFLYFAWEEDLGDLWVLDVERGH